MSITVNDLEFNGETVDGEMYTTNYDVLWLKGADVSCGFTLTGSVTLTWDSPDGNWGCSWML